MIDDWGVFLTLARNGVLAAVADNPVYPWPGPPPGLEGVPSSSRMGEDACQRQAWFSLLSRVDGDKAEYEALPRDGSLEVAPQRGWALESLLREWLSRAKWVYEGKECRLLVHEFEHDKPLIDPSGLYYGHPDGWGEFVVVGEEWPPLDRFLLEYKHQRASQYKQFLARGVADTEPLYYAQVQSLMGASDFDKTLFVITPFDVSTVKGELTRAKKGKNYTGEFEPDLRMIPKSSGVNPVFYMEMVLALPAYQRQLRAWAKQVVEHVKSRKAPDRLYDINKDWQCAYCDFRDACQVVGPCKEDCDHKACNPGDPTPEQEYMGRG